MTFLYPKLFWLLLIPALMLVREVMRLRKNARRSRTTFGEKILTVTAGAATAKLSAKQNSSPRHSRGICVFLILGITLAVTALARPQWGKIEEPVFDQSREILIAVDLSRSMLADDVKPTRLDRARLLIESLLGELKGERVGLIVFSGTSFLQAPLSSDYEILREFLPVIGPDYLPQAGTNYAAMLQTAVDSFGKTSADRFLIVLSDGEADPENPWREIADTCKERGIKAVTLGIGTQAGAMILGDDGKLLKDERGAVVLSKLEPATLQELADITGGIYNDASQWVDIAALIKATVDKGEKGEFREASKVRLAERFQWVLAPSLFFFLMSLWREFPIQPRPRRMALAVAKTLPALLVMLATTGNIFSEENTGDDASLFSPPPGDARQVTVDTSETAKKLSELVTRLAAQNSISSADTLALAEATLAYGEPLRAEGKPVPNGPIDDALEAVTRAEKITPSDADWKTIRDKLNALKQKPSPQKQEQQEQKKEEEEKKDKEPQSQQNKGDADDTGDEQNQKEQQPEQQKNKPSPQDQSQQSNDSSGEQNQNSEQKNDSQSASPQNESKEQNKASDSAGDDKQQEQKQQQTGDENKSGEQKTNPSQADAASEKAEHKPKEEPVKKGEKVFDSMQKNGDEKKPSPQKQQPQESPADGENTQRVGGVAVEGTPLDKNIDPNLLVPLQRLERAKTGDVPGILFRRMQGDQQEKQSPAKGRSW